MPESFVSRKDRIVASAIEIISDSGLSALTTRNLAMKENMSEGLLYKYFSSIDEVLIDVVDYYSRFDKGIRQTVLSKDLSSMEKIREYLADYATFYDNYYAISTIMLQYEELLHKVETREKISWCISERLNFLSDLFEKAIEEKEICDRFTPDELSKNVTGMAMAYILSRRISNHKKTFKQEYMENIDKWFEMLKP
jgi:AcrR family transcriptional regulator